jgi:hypothetical protein
VIRFTINIHLILIQSSHSIHPSNSRSPSIAVAFNIPNRNTSSFSTTTWLPQGGHCPPDSGLTLLRTHTIHIPHISFGLDAAQRWAELSCLRFRSSSIIILSMHIEHAKHNVALMTGIIYPKSYISEQITDTTGYRTSNAKIASHRPSPFTWSKGAYRPISNQSIRSPIQ